MIRFRLSKFLLISLCIFAVTGPVKADRLWLVIGASDTSGAQIVKKAKPLRAPDSLIVQTNDCGDKKNVFAWVAGIASSISDAQEMLVRMRVVVKDAYVKRCDVKPGSLLAFRIPAIDSSIVSVPDDAVNWEDNDRISSAKLLPDGRIFVIVRYFSNESDDPLEGRRERIMMVTPPNTRIILEDNCVSPGRAVVNRGSIAFHCAREQAGDSLLHNVLVFDAAGKRLAEIPHCRNPKWSDERAIACEAESVGSDGRLKLQERRIDVAKSK